MINDLYDEPFDDMLDDMAVTRFASAEAADAGSAVILHGPQECHLFRDHQQCVQGDVRLCTHLVSTFTNVVMT